MELRRIILVIALVTTLTGCQAKGEDTMESSETNNILRSFRNEDAYSSKEESIDYMQSQLEEKYNEDFVISESSIRYDDQTYPTTITSSGTAHSKSKPDYEFEIYSRSTGVFSDSYGNYKFIEGAEKEADAFCAGRDYVDSCDATLTTTRETDNLIEEYPTYEEYREDHSIYYNIHLKGRSPVEHPEDYVDPMIEMITDLLEGEYGNGYLIVDYTGEDYPYPLNVWWEYFNRDNEDFLINSEPEKFLNYDAVLEEIESNVAGTIEMKNL